MRDENRSVRDLRHGATCRLRCALQSRGSEITPRAGNPGPLLPGRSSVASDGAPMIRRASALCVARDQPLPSAVRLEMRIGDIDATLSGGRPPMLDGAGTIE